MTLDEALEWARKNNGDEVVGRLRSRQVVVELVAEINRLRAEIAALRKDAERLTFWQANPRAVSRSTGYRGAPDCWVARRFCDSIPQDFADLRAAIDAAMATRSDT